MYLLYLVNLTWEVPLIQQLLKSDTNKLIQTEYGDIDISGYIQPQFQIAQSKGAKSYGGGDFSQFSNNRFALRRARVKFDYLYDKPGSYCFFSNSD
jgi:hypothetical protein